MTDPTPSSTAGDDDAGDAGSAGRLAGWQKVVGLVGLAVVAALVILLLAGDHGPGRHGPGGGEREQPAEVEGGVEHDPARRNH